MVRHGYTYAWLLSGMLWACAAVTPAPTPGSRSNAPSPLGDGVLATLDGVPVLRSDLGARVNDEVQSLENERLQRQFHLTWVGVESVIKSRLLASEAKARGLSAEELEKQEIDDKIVKPTDEEAYKVYDQHRDDIPVPFEEAAEFIKMQMSGERREELRNGLVERLRAAAQVRYAIPAPDLPRYSVDIGDGPFFGPTEAKVTLVEFSDFECPYCAKASEVIKQLRDLYPETLRVSFRHLPLRQHERARVAAEATECAGEQGKFWPYHDLVFAQPEDMGNGQLRDYAGKLALDLAAFDSCLASDRPKKAVAADEEAARAQDVEGTPTIYINGMKLIGILPLPLMQSLIEKELGR